MDIVELTKKKVVVELDPKEIPLLFAGSIRERNNRRKTWSKLEPKFPEELMYHLEAKDTAEQMSLTLYDLIETYRSWGVLK